MSRDELERLLFGPEVDQQPNGLGTVRLVAYCRGDAEQVLTRCKSVLEVALSLSNEGEFDEKIWMASLPDWFVNKCPAELSQQELDKRLRLPIEERMRLEELEGWPLSAFIYWFEPDQRYWFWWDAVIIDSNTIYIEIEVEDWPFPWGALRWLLRASGAERVEAEE